MATVSSPALAVSGTTLAAAIRRLLLSLNYPRCNVDDALGYVEARGTVEGCQVVEREDWRAVNDLVARHTGDVESDPADWPAWTDAERWGPTVPDPSPADVAWAAASFAGPDPDPAVDDLTLGLVALVLRPIHGGSPDERPTTPRGVRSRVQPDYSDHDHRAAGHAV